MFKEIILKTKLDTYVSFSYKDALAMYKNYCKNYRSIGLFIIEYDLTEESIYIPIKTMRKNYDSIKNKSAYLNFLQIIKLSLDSFLLDFGLKTFTSLNIIFASATISLKEVPKNTFATNLPSLAKTSFENNIASLHNSPV